MQLDVSVPVMNAAFGADNNCVAIGLSTSSSTFVSSSATLQFWNSAALEEQSHALASSSLASNSLLSSHVLCFYISGSPVCGPNLLGWLLTHIKSIRHSLLSLHSLLSNRQPACVSQ